jgi:hypothetical protein
LIIIIFSGALVLTTYIIQQVFTLVDTLSMTATLFRAIRPPTALIIGGSEGGMKRALACSYDITTGTLYRETVLRLPSQSVGKMHDLPRIRLGLKRPFLPSDVQFAKSTRLARSVQAAGQQTQVKQRGQGIPMQPIEQPVEDSMAQPWMPPVHYPMSKSNQWNQ